MAEAATPPPLPAERFSIREYAAKMRSVDFSKCWPFGGESSSLPPISVREFRLWSDEVRTARELDGGPEVEDAAAGDGSEAEMMVDEEGDGRQMKVSVRGKQRTPKKRSIVELFAVAPQVEAAEDDGEDAAAAETEEGSDSGDGGETGKDLDCAVVRRKVKRVKEERKGSGRNKNPGKEKGRKKKKKKILAGKTEKVRNSKLSSLVNISHILQDLVHKKWFGKTSRKPADSQRKNPVVAKRLKKKSNGKLVQPSKLISIKQGEAKLLPVPGILKKRIKGNSVRKGGISVNAHRRNFMKLRCEQPKHVSFSGKDAIHAHNESCSPMEFSQLQNLCKIVSHVLAASSAMDNSSEEDKIAAVAKGDLAVDVNDKSVATSVIVRENEALPEKKQLSCSHAHIVLSKLCSPSKTNCADREKSFIAETLDLNTAVNDSDSICLNPGTSTSSPRLLYSGESNVMKNNRKDDLEHGSENHVEECYPDATSLFGHTRKHVSGSVSSLAISNAPSSQNSVSCVVRTMEGSRGHFQQSVDPNMDLLSHVPEFQAKYHLSPKDVISICSSAGSKRSGESSLTSEPGSTSKDRCIFEDFIGLPLNSQGELIQLHSGAKFGFNEIYKRQNTVSDPIQNLSIPSYVDNRSKVDNLKMKSKLPILNQEDKSYWFPDPYCPASDLLGFRDLQECESSAIPKNNSIRYKDRFTCPEHNPMTDHCHGCQKSSQFHSGIDRMEFQSAGHLNHEFQPASQPTMRLMGKDVTVGKSNQEHHGFDVGKTWTDKVTITENCPSVRFTNNSLAKEWPQQELVTPLTCGTSKGNSLQLSGAQFCSYHMPPTLPRSGPPYFDCQPQWMSTNRVLSTTEKYSSKGDLFRHPVPVQVVLNETPRTLFNSISGIESVKRTHQMPMVASKPQNVCQHMLLSSTQCKHSQGISYSRPSTFHSLFPNQGHIMQPSMASSMQDLPHWMLNAKHQNNQQPCPPYSSQFAVHHPSGMLGADHFPLISPCPTSMYPLPIYSADAPIVCGSSMSPASIAPPPLIPSFSTNKLSSKFNYKYRNKCKNINGEKSKWTYLKGLEDADQSRKRLAANDNEFMKPTKKSSLSIQDDLNATTCPRRGDQFHGYTQQNRALPESPANIRSETDKSIPGLTDGKDEPVCAYGPSSKYNERPRFGPTKLTAGAKHILKPSSSVDQDCPRSIHSTVPFSTGTNSDKLLVPPKKATKIYRF